jgi:hypothetical protein
VQSQRPDFYVIRIAASDAPFCFRDAFLMGLMCDHGHRK